MIVAFGMTLVSYTIWAITVGEVTLVQFVVVWIMIFLSSNAGVVIAYSIAVIAGAILTVPITLLIHLPERGSVRFAGFEGLIQHLNDPKTYAMMAIYVCATVSATYLLRSE